MNDTDHATPPFAARRARWVARLSLVAAFVCFAANCVSNRILWTHGVTGGAALASSIISFVTATLVLVGVVLGAVGIVLGRRVRSPETTVLAVMGLLLNLGIVAIAAWTIWTLRSA